ncbi:hypothetical protein ACOMHN_061170 [Nucella lapillus]
MLKKVVRDRPKDWHRYLPALLFACRELPSESTGFSPFKLLFGRKVRGPVSLLQEVWTDRSQEDEQDKPLYGYIFDLQNRLDEVAKVAMESVAKSSVRGKHYFDRKARDRRFKEGDEVLVLLPSSSNKLLSGWLGPFPVLTDLHPDYRILVKGKEKIFHANMLKKYVRRESLQSAVAVSVDPQVSASCPEKGDISVETDHYVADAPSQSDGSHVQVIELQSWQEIGPVQLKCAQRVEKVRSSVESHTIPIASLCSVGVVDDGDGTTELPSLATPMTTSTPDESICDVKFDSQLSLSQRTELENIFSRHSDILTTKPGCFSDDLFLEIPVTTVVPVKRRMYDIPFSAKEIVEREVQTMLDLRFVRMPFGLVSAPAVFARMMRMLHLEHFSALNFFDDILIHSVDWYSHLQHVEAVLECLRSKGLTARPSKIETGFHSLEFLGHVVVNSLLHKKNVFRCGEQQSQAFQKAKEMLLQADLSVHFNQHLEVTVSCDASTRWDWETFWSTSYPMAQSNPWHN